MSTIDGITVELRAIGGGIDKAAANASGAAAKAGDIAARAGASGFVGIAQGMLRVQTTTRQALEPMRAASERCREIAGSVANGAKGASPKQTIDVLSTATAKTDAVHTGLATAIHLIDEAHRQAGTTLQGGQPGPILAMLGEVKNLLVQMAQQVAKVKQDMAASIAEAGQTGRLGN